jgi:hypothetical protein
MNCARKHRPNDVCRDTDGTVYDIQQNRDGSVKHVKAFTQDKRWPKQLDPATHRILIADRKRRA